jgi:hypothetical protein
MPKKKQKEDKADAERLAKSLRSVEKDEVHGRSRTNSFRPISGGDARRTVANERELSPLARLMEALRKEQIDFILIGMSAAVLQGVPGSTLDIDYWIDLPARHYMQTINLCRRLGAKPLANTVVELEDGTLVNFVYSVTGLGVFRF